MMKILLLTVLFFVFVAFGYFDPQKHKNWNLLQHNTCGQVSSERIIGGKDAAMNAYPWIARIGYLTSNSTEFSFRCSGVVANSKSILTAAHCVINLPNDYKVGVIRLGEHNTVTNPDCDGNFCADPIVDIKPSKIFIPKNYNNPPYKHDIALVFLINEIKFSAFIKPICFISGQLLNKDLVGTIAEVAGWGIYDVGKSNSSTILQVVKLPIVKNEECKILLPKSDIEQTQLCVGGTAGKDSCGGDSGGPLMKVEDGKNGASYFLLGIVSFGSKKCGKSNTPAVYTKMSAYMEWFLDNLEGKTNDSLKVL